jgi:hypothetical protein
VDDPLGLDEDDGGRFAAFLWFYSRRSTDADENCSPRENDHIGAASNHDDSATPLECKCMLCLVRLVLSVQYLDHFFGDNQYTSPNSADITHYNENFTNAAFALRRNARIFGKGHDPMRIFEEKEQKESLDYLDRVLSFSRDIVHRLQGMHIFQTTTGQFGCSPRRPSVGDLVAAIPGGEFLHIISQDKGRYVGAASVHGIMGDVLLNHIQELGDRTEVVTLH